jgi:SAM-dependent methyltransferase
VAVSGIGYDEAFFESKAEEVRRSADAIVPHVVDLLHPGSVVDLGCGTGTWLAAFERHGVDDYLGVDGEWIPRARLEIPETRFVAARLDAPFRLDRTFDLAVSLEVAEHLPESAATRFVESLVRLAPCVLFSAAVPHQGGLHHVNEQWQEYWVELFGSHGYRAVDAVRPYAWSDDRLPFWYAQNTLLYGRPEVIAAVPALAAARAATTESMLSLAHPRLLSRVAADPGAHVRRATARELSLADLADAFPYVLARSVRWRARRLARRS